MTRSTSAEKEKKPMLDLDALEVGFYAKGRDGNFYKVDLPVDFQFAKTINVMTGEVHYLTRYDRIHNMSLEELADYHGAATGQRTEDVIRWLKEEITDA